MKKYKLLIWLVAISGIIIALTGLRGFFQELDKTKDAKSNRKYAENVEDDNALLIWYKSRYKGNKVLVACAEDITNDGIADLVVIYRTPEDEINAAVIIGDLNQNYKITPSIHAPREHQKIRFMNIDNDPQKEFLITGDKNGEVGYAIYSIKDGVIIDLFGEGMEDCC